MSNQKRSIVLMSYAVGVDFSQPIEAGDDLQRVLERPYAKFLAVGGRYLSSDPLYTDGQMGGFRINERGRLMVDTELSLDGANLSIDNIKIEGQEADGAVMTRLPVGVAGLVRSGDATYANGQLAALNLLPNGRLKVQAEVVSTAGSFSFNAGDSLYVAGQPIESDLGMTAFAMSSADQSFAAIDLSQYQKGSVQATWSGATSSAAYDGQIVLEGSNNGTGWATIDTIAIDAADGDVVVRGIDADMKWFRASWVKNSLTGGSISLSSIFKGV